MLGKNKMNKESIMDEINELEQVTQNYNQIKLDLIAKLEKETDVDELTRLQKRFNYIVASINLNKSGN